MTKASWLALGFGFLAAFFWGTHSVIVRYLTSDLAGISIAVFRLYIAAAVLYVILKLHGRGASFSLRDKALLWTTFGVVTNYILFHVGLEHTTASAAMMLENTAPFFVLLFLVLLFRERIRMVEVLATGIAVFGVFFTVRGDVVLAGEALEGDILELLAGLTWAIFLLGSAKAVGQTSSTIERIAFLFNVLFLSAVALTPLAFFFPLRGTVEIHGIFLLVLLGVFPTALASYLWYEAAARLSATSASLLFTLSVVFTFVNAHLFLGEAIT
ncbi:MAG: DMT family transporter, partial [Pseudomonadota bacterium]